jgi:recombinational DNA repair protein RecR
MTFKHPNQSFIDNFYLPNNGRASTPTSVYSKQHLDKKKKEKFTYFVESLTKEVKKSDNSKIAEIAKIFEYNTLSKAKNKKQYVVEEKQDIGNLPVNFTYNGLLYSFNPDLNMFVNQHGHAIDISQATAFMEMAEFEAFEDIGDVDGSVEQRSTPVPPEPPPVETIPLAPTGLTSSNTTSTTVDLSWIDGATNESGFKVFYRTIAPPVIPIPLAPTGLTFGEVTTESVLLNWVDGATNESGFKLFYNSEAPSELNIPTAPTSLTNTNTIFGISFGWSDNSTNEAGFKLFFREKP